MDTVNLFVYIETLNIPIYYLEEKKIFIILTLKMLNKVMGGYRIDISDTLTSLFKNLKNVQASFIMILVAFLVKKANVLQVI